MILSSVNRDFFIRVLHLRKTLLRSGPALQGVTWDPDEARAFLAQRSGVSVDGTGAREIAHALGYLSLALAQAAAYVEEHGCGFDGYLELLKAHPVETLRLRANSPASETAVAQVRDIAFTHVANCQSGGHRPAQSLCVFSSGPHRARSAREARHEPAAKTSADD